MSWSPGWKGPYQPPSSPAAGTDGTAATPDELFSAAGDGPSLLAAQRAYENLLRDDPADYALLVGLSEVLLLRGAAYSPTRRDKAAAYRTGIRAAEAAMATHPGFRRRIDAGAPLAEAVRELGEAQMKAMLLWVTGVSYYFKECLSGLGHVVNFRWMTRTRETLDRMMEVEPDYENGAVYFSLGIHYLGLPASAGGDLVRSQELIDHAVEIAGSHLLPRWGRARYLSVRTGDRDAFESDLAWVLAQDPETADSPFAWNVYMQRDARQLLERTEELFPPGR